MTTPKEALEEIQRLTDSVFNSPTVEAIKQRCAEALASLEGDAVERVARIMDLVEALLQADCEFEQATPGNDQPAYENLKAARAELERSLTTLATGLVADEAAIRADKVMLLLKMIDAASGEIDATDDSESLLNYFCDDRGNDTDTFNLAIEQGLIRTSHNDIFETSRAFLTDAGRAAIRSGGGE